MLLRYICLSAMGTSIAGPAFSWTTSLLNLILTQVNTTTDEYLLWARHRLKVSIKSLSEGEADEGCELGVSDSTAHAWTQ